MNTRRAWVVGFIFILCGLGLMWYGQAIRNNPMAYDASLSTPAMIRLVTQARQLQEFGTWTAIIGGGIVLLGFLFGGKSKPKMEREASVEVVSERPSRPKTARDNREHQAVSVKVSKNPPKKRRPERNTPTTATYAKDGFELTVFKEEIKVVEADGPSYSIKISEIDYVETKENPPRLIINTFEEDQFEYEIPEPYRKKTVMSIEYFISEYDKLQDEQEL